MHTAHIHIAIGGLGYFPPCVIVRIELKVMLGTLAAFVQAKEVTPLVARLAYLKLCIFDCDLRHYTPPCVL
tara:strand:- start:166 stop:378 length:213 start_codon:yes stop_codon:yes gene_type:complete